MNELMEINGGNIADGNDDGGYNSDHDPLGFRTKAESKAKSDQAIADYIVNKIKSIFH